MKILSFFLAVVSLIGCVRTSSQPDVAVKECFNQRVYKDKKMRSVYCPDKKKWRLFTGEEFSFSVPGHLFRTDNSPSEIDFTTKEGNMKNVATDYDIDVSIFPPTTQTPACKAEALGIHPSEWKKRMANNDSVHWGKVTFWNNDIPGGMENLPSTICTPPQLWSEEWYNRKPNQFAAYALCSEKDGKRVLVCVQQMMDNPELAEEIFSTFRWTK